MVKPVKALHILSVRRAERIFTTKLYQRSYYGTSLMKKANSNSKQGILKTAEMWKNRIDQFLLPKTDKTIKYDFTSSLIAPAKWDKRQLLLPKEQLH
ncbi:hypothetical protein HZB69_04695 [Candidatus Amesbacteria bacterium]|nr:hypothetical protein [Candidatus Amesbacteria bacterium]